MITPDQQSITRSRLFPYGTVAAVASLVAGMLAVGAAGFSYVRAGSIERDNLNTQTRITSIQSDILKREGVRRELNTLTQQELLLRTLFDTQTAWPLVFGAIERRLYKSAIITSIQVRDTGEVTITGTVPSYDDYARFFTSLVSAEGQRYFSLVRPGSVARVINDKDKSSRVTFAFTLTLQPGVRDAVSEEALARALSNQK